VRKALGRIALLLGVVLVGAAAWWGATTLFEDDARDDDAASEEPACTPATRQQAKEARTAFAREYAEKRWVSGYGTRKTGDGDGWFLFVVTTRAVPDDLPECLRDVPVSYLPTGPFHAD
jgi:hypothetical protein